MNRLILALLASVVCITPTFAQSLEPSDLPPIQLNQNNVRGGVVGVLAPANGGSGASSSLSNGQLLIGHTGNAPVAANLTAGANISVTNGAGTITVAATGVATSGANSNITALSGLTTPLSVAQGGSGVGTLTIHGVVVGQTTGAVHVTAAGANDLPLVGNTAADPTFRALNLATAVTGVLPVANGGTGAALFSSGTATFMSAGSVDVTDATITSSSIIVVTEVSASPTDTYSVVLDPGVKFTIHSSNSSSAAVVNYIRVK